MTPFERALVGELEGSHGDRVHVGDVHGATALHHYAGLNSVAARIPVLRHGSRATESQVALCRPAPVGPMMSSPFMGGSGIRAVVLDLDDTLVDHQASARRSSARPVLEQGTWTPPENIEEWKSASEGPMVRRRAGEFDRPYYRRGRVIYMRHVLG